MQDVFSSFSINKPIPVLLEVAAVLPGTLKPHRIYAQRLCSRRLPASSSCLGIEAAILCVETIFK